ncbi:MAG TPA: hypothetical protein VNA21_01350 [Steroidobacteraceae bacterium]|nr:hypothetical protein [Steroidobacteraceae bacterium]
MTRVDEVSGTVCPEEDPLRLAANPQVQKMVSFFGLAGKQIRFLGCNSYRFSARSEVNESAAHPSYVVTYPTQAADNFIGAIAHVLSHLLQSELALGMENLKATREARRIELGADFLSGVVFNNALKGLSEDEFRRSLESVNGLFDLQENAHGTRSQRAGAFQAGIDLVLADFDRDLRLVNREFDSKRYGYVLGM